VDIGISPLLLGSALNLIISQRLVKKICTKCKTAYAQPPEMLATLNLKQDDNLQFFRGQGCMDCSGTGFSGNAAAFEVLPLTGELKKLVFKNTPPEEIIKKAEPKSCTTLKQSLTKLVLQGKTTIEQAITLSSE
jgi:type IV pilus assembly protein PilB